MRPVSWRLSLSALVLMAWASALWAQKSPAPSTDTPPAAAPATGDKHETPPGGPLEGWLQKAGRFASGEFGMNPLGFLDSDPVQKDLKLTPEQVAKLKAINEEFRTSRRAQLEGMAGAAPEQRRAKMAEFRAKAKENRAEYQKKVDAVLLPEQRNRLREITLSLRGPLAALADEQVAKTLNLTEEQKKQIQAIEEAAGEKVRSALQALRDRRTAAQGELETKAAELHDQAVQQALGVLTPEQKASLDKMKGENPPVERPRLRPFRRAKPPVSPTENPPPAEKPAATEK